ncbi:Sterol 14-demethylase [Porphyridium purpureum]|uniref:Sterol 14-demethylase n=1 Tax=Porphyridium purpureum TaxID=35688 RepID=A0A5J4YL64_PORPP|nr:Sterol 14-demethylase [Porphyridium purpureum]|eukprot:POR1299..scf261_15
MESARALWSAAQAGDPESIGWVAVGVLALILTVSTLMQYAWMGGHAAWKGDAAARPPVYMAGVPYVSNLMRFIRDPLEIVTAAHRQCGELFTVPIAHKRFTFCVGPEAHEIFCRGSDEELDQTEVYSFSVPVFGQEVVYDAPLETRYQQFRWLSQALRAEKLKSYVPLMVMEAEQAFGQLPQSGSIDLFDKLSELIVMTASRCLLGREVREQMFAKVSFLIHELDQGMQPISVMAPYLPIASHRKRDAAHTEFKRIFKQVIDGRRKSANANTPPEPDMLQSFLDAVYRDGTRLSDDEICGLLIAAIFAGQHTSSITSTWLGMRLLRSPAMLEKVLDEQRRIIAEYGAEINFETLSKMDVLHNCMKETLRMYPPLIFLIRLVLKELHFKDFVVPVGDYLFLSPSVSGKDQTVFSNPEAWDPDRFAPPRSEDKKAAFAYVGFGGGRHGCMGEQFAYLQVKTLWSVMLRNFDMRAVGALPTIQHDALVVGPSPPCTVQFERRQLVGQFHSVLCGFYVRTNENAFQRVPHPMWTLGLSRAQAKMRAQQEKNHNLNKHLRTAFHDRYPGSRGTLVNKHEYTKFFYNKQASE